MLKRAKLVLTSMLAGFLAFPLATKAEEHPLVGIDYPPLPEEVEEINRWAIEEPYSINNISFNGQRLLLLERLTGTNSQVLNVLPLPIMYQTEKVEGGDFCTVNGVEEPNVIVIVKIEDTSQLTKVRKAWLVVNEEFKEISTQGKSFACENFGYGL